MSKTQSSSTEPEVPPQVLWTSPMAWGGSPLRPLDRYLGDLPMTTIFVRAEVLFSLAEDIGPGMQRLTEMVLPGLIRLDKCKPIEVHIAGLDAQCWTYRVERKGRKRLWRLYVGPSHPASEPAPESLLKQFTHSQIVVQSILPCAENGKHVLFIIRDDFTMEDLTRAVDPDPYD